MKSLSVHISLKSECSSPTTCLVQYLLVFGEYVAHMLSVLSTFKAIRWVAFSLVLCLLTDTS